jgi:transposase
VKEIDQLCMESYRGLYGRKALRLASFFKHEICPECPGKSSQCEQQIWQDIKHLAYLSMREQMKFN